MPRDEPIRILHIEDDPLDLELIHTRLENDDIQVTWTHAQSALELEQALATADIDLVLCDYTMPAFDGLDALATVRSRLPDMPFIFVSGTIGEERAVETLLYGATDYVLKDNPARLGPAIRRAIQESELKAERSRVEAELRRTFEELQRLLAASPTVIYSASPSGDHEITFVSDNIRDRLGYEPTRLTTDARFWSSAVHPDDRAEVLALRGRVDIQGVQRYRLRHADGDYRLIEDRYHVLRDESGAPREIVGSWLDVSHLQSMTDDTTRLREQFHQAQKMEAVGVLAGGVAHDFNNILMVILSYSEFLLLKLPPESPLRAEVLEIQKAGNRAADLAHQLLAFSRKQASSPQPVHPPQAVRNLSKMINRLLDEDVTVTLDLIEDTGHILCDPTHFDQILINLILNARDAMPDGGTLTIGCRIETDGRAGDCFSITVTDTGTGIAPEHLSRIFDPFFTTKPAGKGTGLGLAMVWGAVKQNGGRVEVSSEVGTGTAIRVVFPRRVATEPTTTVPVAPPSAVEQDLRILLAEDNDSVRAVTTTILQRLGYTVVAVESAEHALEAASDPAFRIDLLVSDVVMRGMSGPALHRELRKTRPALSVVYCTGYLNESDLLSRGLEPTAQIVHKPFGKEALARAIQAALAGSKRA